MAAPEDLNVDELKRRARRRLIGAIVLALAVAVFVPILLESDPKPLGEDVSVKIPPIDEGKFVNRLNEKAKTEPAKTAPAKTEPPRAEPPKAAPPPAAAEAPKAETAKDEPPKSEPVSGRRARDHREGARLVAAAAPPSTSPSPAHEPAAGDILRPGVRLLRRQGREFARQQAQEQGISSAYTEPVNTSKGTLWRVRIGPYPSREAASAAREKLKGEGYIGIVTAAK